MSLNGLILILNQFKLFIMMKKILLLSAFYLVSSATYSQEKSTLENQIAEKESALESSTNNTRQVNNSIQAELKELYIEFKVQLEKEIESISDDNLKIKKREELNELDRKIANYSQKK